MHRFEEKNLYREIFKDFVILPGGADISPSLYGKKNYKSYVSNSSIEADRRHIEIYKDAVRKGKPLLCICRGLQLISALQGLTLIQDLRHPGGHNLTVRNLDTDEFTDTIKVNSIHHQLVYTNNELEGDNFKVYGHCMLSDYHSYQKDEEVVVDFEPEIILFPKVRALGVQFHPEMMGYQPMYNETLNYLKKLVNLLT